MPNKPYLGLQSLVFGGVWYHKQNPHPTPVTGYAFEVTTGVYKGSIYPIESILYHERGDAEVKCRSVNGRSKTLWIKEYSGQGYKIIPYTGEAVIKKSEIVHYDMFGNEISAGDWMFTEEGLRKVVETTKTGIKFEGTWHGSEHRRDWTNYAVVNDTLLENANKKIEQSAK